MPYLKKYNPRADTWLHFMAVASLLACPRAAAWSDEAAPAGSPAAGPVQTAPPDSPTPSPAETPAPVAPRNVLVGKQFTAIWQSMAQFHSPFQGTNSLQSISQAFVSHTYTIYTGFRLNPSLEFYVDPEMAKGAGISSALGLAGFTNGDVIRNPELGGDPYAARYFMRWTRATGLATLESVDAGELQIPEQRPDQRLVLTLGKVGATDIFDLNRYSDSTRTQFMNWALINNAAWDYAADTRGYTFGMAAEWVHPTWAIRAGSFEMPTIANGAQLSSDLGRNRGDQVELELEPQLLSQAPDRTHIRMMAYHNVANMGDYEQALEAAEATGTIPNITAVRHQDNTKYGYTLNIEQALADKGDTGLFARLGWDDGNTESFAYTECDAHLSLGFQLSGGHWSRPQDHWALAVVDDNLSAPHANYLAAGGLGFLLGDGRLSYGPEQVLETYYAYQMTPTVTLSLDYQGIKNPGYDTARGPVSVWSVRFHFER